MADASRDITPRQVLTATGRLQVADLLADPDMTPLADAMLDEADQRRWLLGHTARQFGADPLDPGSPGITSVLPQFFGDGDQPSALPARLIR